MWLEQTLDDLEQLPAIGYSISGQGAAEPTAMAAMALVAHGRVQAANKAAEKLVTMQHASGMVGVRAGEETPGWPTSLAIVAWSVTHRNAFQGPIERGVRWLVTNRGRSMQRSDDFGHNTELVGWAYAEQTHSWVEPTAFGVLALKAAGKRNEAAAQEGINVLIDRQLPGGGLNYGNTYVLGQLIRPHIQPTGIGLLSLGGESDSSGRTSKSITWLRRSIGSETTPQSLAWALLGLKVHGVEMPQAGEWLAAAAARVRARDGSPFKLALLCLAAKGWPA